MPTIRNLVRWRRQAKAGVDLIQILLDRHEVVFIDLGFRNAKEVLQGEVERHLNSGSKLDLSNNVRDVFVHDREGVRVRHKVDQPGGMHIPSRRGFFRRLGVMNFLAGASARTGKRECRGENCETGFHHLHNARSRASRLPRHRQSQSGQRIRTGKITAFRLKVRPK